MRDLSIYLSTAVCACHINFGPEGFRQKDVHFYFDLFSNWMEASLGKRDLQNIQVQRFLDQLVKKQILKKSNKLIYTCNDHGLIPLLSDITTLTDKDHLELFFFQYHILQIYHERLFQSIDRKLNLPHGLKIELKYILDHKVLLQKQRERIQMELEKLQLRVDETLEMEKMTTKMYQQGKDTNVILSAVEKTYPYQLHHQKKMSDLFMKLDPVLRKAELTQNAGKRVAHLWAPMIRYYSDYIKRLDELV